MRHALSLALALLLALPSAFAQDAPPDAPDGEEQPARLSADDIPAVIATAEVGDWVLYKLTDGSTSKLTVVEKWEDHGDTYLVIRKELKKRKKRAGPASEERIIVSESVAELRTLAPDDYVVRGDVLVRGRKAEAVVIHYVDDGKLARQSYISERVPLYGLARAVEVDGEKRTVVMALQDYGYAWEDE